MASEEQIPPAVANTQERPHEQQRCVEKEENVVYLDDEGNIIPPESEASCLMAMALGPLPDDDTGASSEWLGGETPALVLDGEGMQEFASNLLLLEDEEEEEFEEASPTTPGPAEQQQDEDDDEGMVGARTFSDVGEDEEWVLERIVKRRLNKETKEHEYLCKWKWYVEHTWEEKEWLLDQGHGKEVQAVDDARMPAKSTLRYTTRPKKEPGILAFTKSLLEQFPNLIQDVCQQFRRNNYRVTQFAECPPSVARMKFMKTWANEPNSKPVILFHGTRFANIPSINSRGLIVPGRQGVRVENGSAHGVGIYTAKTPSIPLGYCRDNDKMFVCLGLINDKVRCHHDVCVFFEESRVMPLWVVEHVYHYSHPDSVPHEPHLPKPVPMKTILNCRVRDMSTTSSGNTRLAAQSSTSTGRIINASPLHPQSRVDVPTGTFRNGGMSKKMLKQQPRWIKDLYKGGQIPPKHK